MLYKDVRGSPIYEPQSVSTFSGLPDTKPMHVGFRLLHDIAFAACIGTMHNGAPEVASAPDRSLVSPLVAHRNLGFRLTREST